MNILNSATTQFTNYNFNSICKFGETYLGATDSGLFVLNSGSKDNTTNISARFRTMTNDFGASNQKRIRTVYINGEGNGDVKLTVRNDEANSREYTFELSEQFQKGYKKNIGRDGKGRHWDFEFANVDGSDFSIDLIEAIPIILNRKPPY